MRSLNFPAGIRPWNDADPIAMAARFGFLQNRITKLTADNAKLKQELAKSGTKAVAAPVPTSVYRRARRVVGKALQNGR